LVGEVARILYGDWINYPFYIWLWVSVWTTQEHITILGGLSLALVCGWWISTNNLELKISWFLPLVLSGLAYMVVTSIFLIIGTVLGGIVMGASIGSNWVFIGIGLAQLPSWIALGHLIIIAWGNFLAAISATIALKILLLFQQPSTETTVKVEEEQKILSGRVLHPDTVRRRKLYGSHELTKLADVGPSTAEEFIKYGITSLEQLASLSDKDIEKIAHAMMKPYRKLSKRMRKVVMKKSFEEYQRDRYKFLLQKRSEAQELLEQKNLL
jgi:hypothetical protein